ncbi:heparan-alpha-glucosaminide N-acetyltransferase domain-containing protein [Dyadobacter sp. LJ53]|uniref:acyltransferase family protein n=1 Tax=Dyadobacter chenwenxiniae TaxID=2906456 RepID=UPI001F249CE1|nr:heparan-alpha-glucosaminide N-acetyltransferase domain-containing protein [Dyadobacter chenwenxiniae]MCF0053142.1 heparan-alpha-glucosaminide N-acetyltransferase domain-containing protein [Dyadobacter chenwenxiniae]
MTNETGTFTRLLSLDAMRGFTIAAMIMVNFPGSEAFVFPTLRHSKWNGLTFTDLIAPVFLFIVGVSIAFAYSKRLERGDAKTPLYQKIVFRSLKIFAVGMFLNLLPHFDFSDLRYTGTLHRIAIVFLFCAILFLNTTWKQQASIGLAILILYWLAMTLIPTPGTGKVMLEPGSNLAAWVDQQYLPGKMWQGNWDPEGILSTFPSFVTGITGMLAGRLMLSNIKPHEKVNYMMVTGFFSCAAGYFWNLTFPTNENLWTSSFVLVTSGFAAILLGTLYFLMDISGRTKGTAPGIIFGANAITIYVLADVFALFFYLYKIYGHTVNAHAVNALVNIGFNPQLASLLYALFFVGINFIPAYILYRRKIFIKL